MALPSKGGRSVTMLPHRARDVLHGRTVDRQQVVAGNEAAKVRRAGRVNAPDDDLPCEPCNRYARAWVYQVLIGHAGYQEYSRAGYELAASCWRLCWRPSKVQGGVRQGRACAPPAASRAAAR